MTYENIVLESGDQIDSRTSHAIAAAQLRGEARARGRNPLQVVRAIAVELKGLGLRPNLRELSRRYDVGESTPFTWQREGSAAQG